MHFCKNFKFILCASFIFFLFGSRVFLNSTGVNLYAQNNSYSRQFGLTIEPLFGVLNGKIEEGVFRINNEGQKVYESRLDWDVKNILFFGADFTFTAFNYVNFKINFIQGISGASGYMKDYDWLNFLYWPTDDENEITNYSIHSNTLNNYSKMNFELSGNIPILGKILIIPIFGIAEEFIKFTGSDGYCEYKKNNWKRYNFDGDVISYQQTTEGWYVGLGIQVLTLPFADFYIDFKASPLANIEALDNHLARETITIFNDKLYSAIDFEWNAKAYFMIRDFIGVGIRANFEYIPMVYGADWCYQLWGWNKAEELGSSTRFLWNIQGGVTFKL